MQDQYLKLPRLNPDALSRCERLLRDWESMAGTDNSVDGCAEELRAALYQTGAAPALAQQPPAADEAMVERACKAFLAEIWPDTYEDADDLRAMIRRILSAALIDRPQGDKQ